MNDLAAADVAQPEFRDFHHADALAGALYDALATREASWKNVSIILSDAC